MLALAGHRKRCSTPAGQEVGSDGFTSRQPAVIFTARRRHTLAMLLFVAVLALLAGLGTAAECTPDGHGGFIVCNGGSSSSCIDISRNGDGSFTICGITIGAPRDDSCWSTGSPPGGGGPPPATPTHTAVPTATNTAVPPPPTPTPVPQAIGGFSAGSWSGPTKGQNLPAAAYHYGILDASSDPSTTVSVICNAQSPGAITYASNSITDTSKAFPPGAFVGGTIQIGNYFSGRTTYAIIANDAQTITISGSWSSTPATDTPYLVLYLNNGVRQQTGGADLDSPSFGPGAVTRYGSANVSAVMYVQTTGALAGALVGQGVTGYDNTPAWLFVVHGDFHGARGLGGRASTPTPLVHTLWVIELLGSTTDVSGVTDRPIDLASLGKPVVIPPGQIAAIDAVRAPQAMQVASTTVTPLATATP